MTRHAEGGEAGKTDDNDEDEGGDKEARLAAALKPAVRRLLIALICDNVGSHLFRSAVVSYCAMHSRERLRGSQERRLVSRAARQRGTGDNNEDETRRRQAALGGWKSPGNYTSHLSAMIWTA